MTCFRLWISSQQRPSRWRDLQATETGALKDWFLHIGICFPFLISKLTGPFQITILNNLQLLMGSPKLCQDWLLARPNSRSMDLAPEAAKIIPGRVMRSGRVMSCDMFLALWTWSVYQKSCWVFARSTIVREDLSHQKSSKLFNWFYFFTWFWTAISAWAGHHVEAELLQAQDIPNISKSCESHLMSPPTVSPQKSPGSGQRR